MLAALLLLALLTALGLGFTAFAAAPGRRENRAFAAFQWLAAVWVLNDLAFFGLGGEASGQRWARTALLLALALQLALLRFARAFRAPASAPGPSGSGAGLVPFALLAGGAAVPVLAGACFGEVVMHEGRLRLELRPAVFAVGAALYALFLGGVLTLLARRRAELDPLARRLLGRFLLAVLLSGLVTSLTGVLLPLLGVTALLPATSLGILLGAGVHLHSLYQLGFLRPPGPVEPGRGLPVTARLALAVALFALLGAGGALLAARLALGPGDPAAWQRAAVLGVLAASFPAMGLILVAQRVVTRPLGEITAAALRVSAGEQGVRVPVPARGDEVALLAGALDEMIVRLDQEREAERELAEKLRRAERLSLAGTLAAGVAHEVNNPLAAVSSLVQLVAERAPEGEPSRAMLHEALGQIDRISGALRELMDLARPAPRARARLRLAEVVQRTARLARFDRRFRRIDLRLEAPPDGPQVQADPDQLGQVLLNLLLNAADALAGRPGRVVVTVEPRPGEALLRVEDSGPGIAPEVQARLFEPFFSTKPAGQGTGLGLAVCRDLVREHGGRIELRSQPGRGTTVEVTLPAAPEEVTA